LTTEKKYNYSLISSGVIVLFHIIGAIGIKVKPELFLQTSFFNLCLSAVLVFWNGKPDGKQALVLMGLMLLAFIIEVIGVTTGFPFGTYYYGSNLGPKIFDVPLIIGVNWILLLYCTNIVFLKYPWFTSALYSAVLMVLLDFVMEQNVEKLGFWFWQDSMIPFINYVSWFFISFVFAVVIKKWTELKSNATAITLYITQILFFVYCYFVI